MALACAAASPVLGAKILRTVHDHEGGDGLHLRQDAQHFGMPVLVMYQILGLDPQQIFDCPGDVVTFRHLWRAQYGAFERLLRGFRVAVQPDCHIGNESDPQFALVQNGPIATNDAGAFKVLHAPQTGRWGKTRTFGQFQIRQAPVAPQFAQYRSVYFVYFRHELQIYVNASHIRNQNAAILNDKLRMTRDLLLALIGFAFATSVTPGPNNMMLLASGVNFGFRRTLPHMLGVSLGHALMVFLVGLGLAQVFAQWPALNLALKFASVAYMLWLAWKIAHAAAPSEGPAAGAPFTFVQAAAFQWVNPKAWAMALTAVTVYSAGNGFWPMLAVAGVFCATNLPSVSIWAYAGQGLRHWLTTNRRLVLFNRIMAVLLVLSLWPVLA